MNINKMSVRELKHYIRYMVSRCAASAEYAYWMSNMPGDAARFTDYVQDIMELVESSRLAQKALARLIKIDGKNMDRLLRSEHFIPQPDPCLGDQDFDSLKGTFVGRVHFCFGQTHGLSDAFKPQVLGVDEDHSKFYAGVRVELARTHEAALIAQIALSQILLISNTAKYKSRYL